MIRMLLMSLTTVLSVSSVLAQSTDVAGGRDAAATVASIVSRGLNDNERLSPQDRRNAYTPALNDIIDAFFSAGDPLGHGRAYDADELTGTQGGSGLKIEWVTGFQTSDTQAIVFVHFKSCLNCFVPDRKYVMLKLPNGHWGIDDIIDGDLSSFREYVRHVTWCEKYQKVDRDYNKCAIMNIVPQHDAKLSETTTVFPASSDNYSWPLSNPTNRANRIQMVKEGGVYAIPIRFNDIITLDGIVDSGATDVSIPADLILTLIRAKTISSADFIDDQIYVLADGSRVPSKRLMIRKLTVGDVSLDNVVASVSDVKGSILLGQSFLEKFSIWSMDNKTHTLVLK